MELHGKTRARVAGITALILGQLNVVSAQTDSGVESIITTTVASFAMIIVSIIVLMLYRRVSGKRRDSTLNPSGLDLMTLKSKGLLTPEEMEKVSRSIARRMEEKEAARRKAEARPSPESLLLDPEVRRLQALAEESGKTGAAEPGYATSPQASVEVMPLPTDNPGEPASEPEELYPDKDDEESLDSIELPFDVQQLADSGVLTPEEIQTVKRRILAKKRAL